MQPFDREKFCQVTEDIISAGRYMDTRGWVPATSGNFSARVDAEHIAITVSSIYKGCLQTKDIMLIDNQGNALDDQQPSAETLLHTALYAADRKIGAVLHSHSMNATLLSKLAGNEVVLQDYELLKALRGVKSHSSRITIPVFPNDQDIPRLCDKVNAYHQQDQALYAYLIAGHGCYTWGESVNEALRHLDALDYLFACELRLLGMHRQN